MKNLSGKLWLVFVLVLFLAFFFFLHWNSFNAPFERDEGEYAYSAWLLGQGQVPYRDSFLQKPPLIVFTYYLGQRISPAVWPPRLFGFLFTLLSCLLLAMTARRISGRRAGWFALWISPLLLSSPYLTGLSANTEKFMLLPLCGLLALAIFKPDRERAWVFIFSGFLAAAAILYKPIALFPAGLILGVWLYQIWRSKGTRPAVASLILILTGGILTALSIFLYFFLHGAGPDIWRQLIIFNGEYAADMGRYFPAQFWHFSSVFWKNWWPVLLLGLFSVFSRSRIIALLWSLLAVSLLTVICSPIGHYYLLLMPFIILLASDGVENFLRRLKIEEKSWDDAALAASIVFVLLVAGLSVGEQLALRPAELSVWIYGADNPFPESPLMSEKIRENTRADERIFVIGSEPQLYYLSGRQAASKFDITYPFSINTPSASRFQADLVADLRAAPPAAIVLSRYASSGTMSESIANTYLDYLDGEIDKNYRLVGGTRLDLSDSAAPRAVWEGPDRAEKSGLLLYVRNDKK